MAKAGARLLVCAAILAAGAAALAQNSDPLVPRLKTVAAVPAPAPQPQSLLKPAQPIPADALAAFIDGAMAASMKGDHIAGVAVAVVQDGKVAFKRGYGVSAVGPDRPVDPDRTLFRLGSVSKLLTWTAVAQDIEAGKLDPKAPVDTYLPPELHVKTAFPGTITLETLMSHSAGFEDRALGHLLTPSPDKLTSLDDFLLSARPLQARAPGHPSYSNWGADLAGRIVAGQAGTDFETAIDRQIAQPLGLQRTTFREPRPARAGLPAPMDPVLAADLSQGFRWKQGAFKPQKVELLGPTAPAGSATSTAADMAQVMLAMLGGGEVDGRRLYGPKAAELLRTPIHNVPAGMNGWAHGLMIGSTAGHQSFGHNGDTVLFHSSLVTIPELNLGIVVLTNTEDGNVLATRLPDLVVERFYGRAPVGGAFRRPAAGEMKPYEGLWISTRRGFTGPEKFLGLMQGGETKATADGLLIDSGSGSKPYLPTVEPGVFRTPDRSGVVSFDLKDGKPVRWRTAGNSSQWERVSFWDHPMTIMVAVGLAVLAAIAVIVGCFTRVRPCPETAGQKLASRLQTAAAAIWLTSLIAFGIWAMDGMDLMVLALQWPGPFMTAFSWLTVLGAILSAAGLIFLAPVWGGHGERSWGLWRRLRYSMTAVIFLSLAAVLAARGAMQPWTL
jgi:CubicO group peptidase (beta-lactamase class C family)